MVKVTDQEFYMDGYLKANLDASLEGIKKDWDMVFCIDGYEGSGKSVLAQQIAYYVDKTFNLSRITFRAPAFEEQVLKAKKHQAVIFDEAYSGLSSKEALSMVNKGMVKMMAEIRQKNLYVIVVCPTFMDLDKYVAIWRSRALFHVYSHGWERGFFTFFDQKKKKILYVRGKKFYDYTVIPSNFYGSYTNHYTVSEEKYRAAKLKALATPTGNGTTPKSYELWKRQRDALIRYLHDHQNHTQKQISRVLKETYDIKIARETISSIFQNLKKPVGEVRN